jgi:hypothetical protein
MPRVHPPTLRPLAAADQPALNRRLRRVLMHELARLQPAVARSAAACGAERYRKHFDSYAHAGVLLFHGLSASPSLRQSYAGFAQCPGLVSLTGLGTSDPDRLGVCFSHLADSNTTRPAAFLAGLIPGQVARVSRAGVEVVQLYLWRWDRAVLPLAQARDGTGLRVLGYSPNAVELSVWLALVVHRLTLLIRHRLGSLARTTTLLTLLRLVLSQLSIHDLADLTPATALPQQLCLPGLAAAPT